MKLEQRNMGVYSKGQDICEVLSALLSTDALDTHQQQLKRIMN